MIKSKIQLAGNTISKNEINRLSSWLKKNNKLTKGKLTIKFEKLFSSWLKNKYSIFVNSGSSANLLIAQSLLESGYLKNKTVIAPAVSWITTVTPFLQLGYKVKLCDCDRNNLGLDINHFEQGRSFHGVEKLNLNGENNDHSIRKGTRKTSTT